MEILFWWRTSGTDSDRSKSTRLMVAAAISSAIVNPFMAPIRSTSRSVSHGDSWSVGVDFQISREFQGCVILGGIVEHSHSSCLMETHHV
jgi:hypothetical protein